MLYVAQIDVPNRGVWGSVHSLELLLPSKIRRINGFLTNAVLGANTRLKRCYSSQFAMEGGVIKRQTTYIVSRNADDSIFITNDKLEVFADSSESAVIDGLALLAKFQEPITNDQLVEQPISSQIGVVSLSLNNTQIIADSTPLCVSQHLNKQGIVPNTITLPKPEKVQGGSFLRIIIEEQQLSPLLTKEEWNALGDISKEGYFGEGNTTTEPTNNYTAKIYLNYD
jgi:hypothetical protein